MSRVEIEYSGCHSLHVNPGTETILQLGFSNVVNVWQYDRLTHEIVVVGKLVGHRSIVMCVDSIGNSTVIATGDDKGYIKLWDLTQFRCFQTLKISTK